MSRRCFTFVVDNYATVPCPLCGGEGFERNAATTVQDRCWFCLGRGSVRALPNLEKAMDTSAL
jgi:DnaJ-class molecular chaperone